MVCSDLLSQDNERPSGGRDSNSRNDFGGRGDTRGRVS